MEKYLRKCINISPKHVCSLFDKLVTPVLCYLSEVWGFHSADAIERLHLKFVKVARGQKYNTK